jgi:hypothetical protein
VAQEELSDSGYNWEQLKIMRIKFLSEYGNWFLGKKWLIGNVDFYDGYALYHKLASYVPYCSAISPTLGRQ